MIQELMDKKPKLHPKAFVHDMACVIGDVTIESGASIWPGVVLRGDMGSIHIGKNSSIQDGSIGHMTEGFSKLIVGDNVTVGHGVILHGCVIGDGCLIGMGSIILDNTHIGNECFVAAGSLVTGNQTIPDGSSVRGSPAKVIRPVNDMEKTMCMSSVEHYLRVIEKYQTQLRLF